MLTPFLKRLLGGSPRETAHQPAEPLTLHHDALIASGNLVPFEYPIKPRVRKWTNDAIPSMLRAKDHVFEKEIDHIIERIGYLAQIKRNGDVSDTQPFWDNVWFPPLDAMHLYSLIARIKPRIYMEVGSGNSTKFVRKAISDFALKTKIVSIDPSPQAAAIDAICDEVVRQPLEDTDLEIFDRLEAGDCLFVDNSHVGLQGSDVTVFFTEVLPRIKVGVVWGMHDIFLPHDYPEEWLGRHYNEQYLLMSYLLGGAIRDSILFATNYVALSDIADSLRRSVVTHFNEPSADRNWLSGGSFWFSRVL